MSNRQLETSVSADWSTNASSLVHEECSVFSDEEDQKRSNTEECPIKFLIVLVHGLFGSSNDFEQLLQLAIEKFPFAIVHVSTINTPSTTSGIRIGGMRLASEIVQVLLQHYKLGEVKVSCEDRKEFKDTMGDLRRNIRSHQKLPNITSDKFKLIIIGHSLGGLYSRNALGLLYENRFFHPVDGPMDPFEYISIATPHLGSRRPKGSNDVIGRTLKYLIDIGKGIAQTAKDLSLTDDPDLPILLEMTQRESIYFKALSLFICTTISTTHYDKIVPFPSSAILLKNPYEKPNPGAESFLVAGASGFSNEQLKEICNHIDHDSFLYKKTFSTEALDQLEASFSKYIEDEDGLVELYPNLYENLRKIPWRRLHLQFPTKNTIEELFTHQIPLGKPVPQHLGTLFGVSDHVGEARKFLQLLLQIIEIDEHDPPVR